MDEIHHLGIHPNCGFIGDDAVDKSVRHRGGAKHDMTGLQQAEKAFHCCRENENSHAARFHPSSAVTVAAL